MNKQPVIGVNLIYLIPAQVGGSETVVRNVLREWPSIRPDWQFTLITTPANHDTFADADNVSRHRVDLDPRKRFRRVLWEQLSLPRLLHKLNTDVLFSPAYYGPLRWSGRHVVFVHDMNYERHPEDFGPLHLQILRRLVPATCRRADRILTSSQFAKGEIARYCPGTESKIVVTPFGSDHMDAAHANRPQGVTKPYFLCVARWYPHKNLPFLVQSFIESGLAGNYQLVMVGGGAGQRAQTISHVAGAGLQDSVLFLNGLPLAELVALFQHCHLLISPSMYEGFGLPILEAMRLRAPILCSDLPIHREVTAGHAHFFPLADGDALRRSMCELAADESRRNAHVDAAFERSLKQTWEMTARGFAKVFESLIGSG